MSNKHARIFMKSFPPFLIYLLCSISSAYCVESLDYCPNQLKEYQVEIHSKVQLLSRYVKNDDDITKTIQHQVNYLNPYFVNHKLPVVLSKIDKIEIKNKKNYKHRFSMLIDNKNFESPEDPYYTAILAQPPKVNEEIDMLEVEYQAALKLVKCQDTNIEVAYHLPILPELAYWVVEPSKRLEYTYINGSKDIVNPCATNELADFNKPYYFWYFWNPDRNAHGDLCAKSYKTNEHNVLAQVKLEETPAKVVRKTASNSINKISIIYGNLNQKFNQHDLDQIHRNYLKKNQYFDMLDLNAQNLFTFLDYLKRYFSFEIKGWTHTENSIIATLENQQNQIELFIGSTDIHSVLGAQHQAFFANALMQSDLVIYSGHAGLGENFKIPATVDLSQTKAKELAFVSCYSYRYGEEEKWLQTPSIERVYYTGYDVTHGYKEILKILNRTLKDEARELPKKLALNEGFSFIKEIRL
jgi:hypothetical protein